MDIETRVDAEVAARMEQHNLKQAHARLAEARTSIKNLRVLDLPEYIADDLRVLTDRIDDSMWRIESQVKR